MAQQTGPDAYAWMANPSRNFNILAMAAIVDPRDGRDKLVLSNFAAGSTGNLIFIDVETGDGESVPLPGDNGAWAMLHVDHERLLVGTCSGYGYLHCLHLRARTWAPPLRIAGETYIWELALGSDGLVYGGTYPGCALLRYDPAAHTLTSPGRASRNGNDLYCRYVDGGVPGYVLVSGGVDTPFVAAYRLDSGEFHPVDQFDRMVVVRHSDSRSIRVEDGERIIQYDPATFRRVKVSAREPGPAEQGCSALLPDGRAAVVGGQDYAILPAASLLPAAEMRTAAAWTRIPTEPPATQIHTLLADEEGHIWGASGFGQTIFRFHPGTGDVWNSSAVCDAGGEVYGMVFADDRLFMSCYSGGDHVVYDPTKPWNQRTNDNPRTLQSAAPALIRPTGRSVLGPDGGIWTGWSAQYGVYGGGLTRVDVATLAVQIWYDPIPGQQLAGLARDSRYLYFITDGGSSGLPYKQDSFYFVVWSAEGNIVYRKPFAPNVRLSAIVAHQDRVYIGADDCIHVFHPQTMEFGAVIAAGSPCSCLLGVNDRTVAAFCGSGLYDIRTSDDSIGFAAPLPGRVGAAALSPDGRIYFACGTGLYRVERFS